MSRRLDLDVEPDALDVDPSEMFVEEVDDEEAIAQAVRQAERLGLRSIAIGRKPTPLPLEERA